MNRNYLIAIVASIALHLAVLSCVPQPKKEEKKAEQQAQKDSPAQAIKATLKPPEVRIIEQPQKSGKGKQVAESDCKSNHFYTGIGIISAMGMVVDVAAGGPADKAGVRAGDTIFNSSVLGRDRHPVGTKLELNIYRDDKDFKVTVVIEKICYVEQQEANP